jgi:hypothetical protein
VRGNLQTQSSVFQGILQFYRKEKLYTFPWASPYHQCLYEELCYFSILVFDTSYIFGF